MKLYTELQVAEAVMFGRWGGTMKKDYEDFLNKLTPIELPSDEDIEKQSIGNATFAPSFINGAQYVIQQITERNMKDRDEDKEEGGAYVEEEEINRSSLLKRLDKLEASVDDVSNTVDRLYRLIMREVVN